METTDSRRLWRLRKLHHYADAELHVIPSSADVELRLLFDGALMSSRRVATREIALAEAAARRAELEREGWMFHW